MSIKNDLFVMKEHDLLKDEALEISQIPEEYLAEFGLADQFETS